MPSKFLATNLNPNLGLEEEKRRNFCGESIESTIFLHFFPNDFPDFPDYCRENRNKPVSDWTCDDDSAFDVEHVLPGARNAVGQNTKEPP